jgi:hypothetical protein
MDWYEKSKVKTPHPRPLSPKRGEGRKNGGRWLLVADPGLLPDKLAGGRREKKVGSFQFSVFSFQFSVFSFQLAERERFEICC